MAGFIGPIIASALALKAGYNRGQQQEQERRAAKLTRQLAAQDTADTCQKLAAELSVVLEQYRQLWHLMAALAREQGGTIRIPRTPASASATECFEYHHDGGDILLTLRQITLQ